MLREGCASDFEIDLMQTADYSKTNFHLQYPLLQKYDGGGTVVHYYAKPLTINSVQYRMCCEWFEKEGANNDRTLSAEMDSCTQQRKYLIFQ